MKPTVIGLVGLAAALAAAPAFAHHSFAMFDNQKTITLEGTVTEFAWENPHSWVRVMGRDRDQPTTAPVVWNLEAGGVFILKRQGWTRNSIKPGDKAVVTVHPLHNGDPGGSLIKITVNGTPVGDERG